MAPMTPGHKLRTFSNGLKTRLASDSVFEFLCLRVRCNQLCVTDFQGIFFVAYFSVVLFLMSNDMYLSLIPFTAKQAPSQVPGHEPHTRLLCDQIIFAEIRLVVRRRQQPHVPHVDQVLQIQRHEETGIVP